MVERYFNNEDESEQFFEDDDDNEEHVAYVDQDGLLEVMQMDLTQNELNQALLAQAISVAEKSFFWRFRSTSSKMKEIGEIYKKLMEMTQEEGEE
jgi:Uma2 family endonuclease